MKSTTEQIYKNKKVLITGHTGFKGSWLSLWLCQMGSEVVGYALAPDTSPGHYELLGLDHQSIIADIRDADKLHKIIRQEGPEIIFHLAAQPIVRKSYHNPTETFSTNVMGTVNLLNACRQSSSVRAVVVVTSDKCYENQQRQQSYCETDSLGGHDPYSASKGCAEIVTSSYRDSFFPIHKYGRNHTTLIASARAGNVIGGGDWAQDRLIPDVVQAVSENRTVFIRNPNATRPWQHVLDCLSGYLMLGQKLLEQKTEFAQAWNFGPGENGNLKVEVVLRRLQQHWSNIIYQFVPEHNFHEDGLLQLDCSKANKQLGWTTTWDIDKALEMTVEWYRHFYEHQEVISQKQLMQYIQTSKTKRTELQSVAL